jgi:cyclic pyranopterin phosphate synthase
MLIDSFGRSIDYLRVSVTDQCDLRCQYCRPSTLPLAQPLPNVLTNAEIVAVVRAAALLGVRKVRLTGGEPLLRHGIVELVGSLAAISGISDLSLTTNGLHLETLAPALAAAGLKRVNVSLDTLRPERFVRITGAPGLERVRRGIEAARAAGLQPVKVNAVIMRGVNDDEITDFAALTVRDGWHVRFIEVMPIGQVNDSLLVSAAEMLAKLPGATPDDGVVGFGPARGYRLPGATGTIAIISPVTDHFCRGCNRLRLTADGKLRPCLLDDGEVDLHAALHSAAAPDELAALIVQAVANKPQQHHLAQGCGPRQRTMTQIGG